MTLIPRLSPRVLLIVVHSFIAIVGTISVCAYLTVFPPHYRGWPEITSENSVAGWAVNEAAPERNVEVQLYVDDHFVTAGIADLARPDVVAAGRAKSDRCGFNFALPPLEKGEHRAQVYAVHEIGSGSFKTLQRLGKPLFFQTP